MQKFFALRDDLMAAGKALGSNLLLSRTLELLPLLFANLLCLGSALHVEFMALRTLLPQACIHIHEKLLNVEGESVHRAGTHKNQELVRQPFPVLFQSFRPRSH
jgi:hypothetical protein